ncbi:sensor histidine kinase [Thalassovita sp.]|uniref:sensor histidine kinase n=1 Tax=Thalassovita sp. TaxID=1979401 RepID=UPI0029DE6431|nr:sensor histidine kinase [Thalassovita sp.]
MACPPVQLDAGPGFRVDLGPYACAFSDADRSLTLAQILALENGGQFRPVPGGLVDFGFGDARYWVAVSLRNATSKPGVWWVLHDMPVAQTFTVQLVPENSGADSARTLLSLDASNGFNARPIPHRHLVSEVALGSGETATLIISYTTEQATEMPLTAETVAAFMKRSQQEMATIIALIALVLGMGFINTIYLYSLNGRPALAYGAYVLASVFLLVHMEGYTLQFVWPEAPRLNQLALPVISVLTVVLGIVFVNVFTQTRGNTPCLHRAAWVTSVLLVCLAILSPLLISEVWFKRLVLVSVGIGTTLQVFLAWSAVKHRHPGGRFLVAGFGALAASFLFGILGYLTEGMFEQELAGIAIRFGYLTEALAFSAAIALRVRAARREHDAALREQLRLSRDRLNLSEALRRAEDDRQRAANAAQRSREALASTAHDLRQPLASLEMELSHGMAASDGIVRHLKYIDEIVRAGLEESCTPLGAGDTDPPNQNAKERFNAGIILTNLESMFQSEAARKGITLRVLPSTRNVVADPLALLRIVGNLVSNALNHAEAEKVLVGCRIRQGQHCFEVHDNGKGIVAENLERLQQPGQKGNASDGHGLGLSIVTSLASENGMTFALTSTPGRGTSGRICIAPPGSAPFQTETKT